MIIITIADIHGSANIIDSFASVFKGADVILLAGDITNFGDASDAQIIIEKIRMCCNCVMAVAGNCDTESVERYLKNQGISLDGTIIEYKGINFTGLGGTLSAHDKFPGGLKNISEKIDSEKPFIFLSHQPPYGTKIDTISDKHHIGSPVIYEFIKKHKPILAFSGHAHEGAGIDKIGDTIIVNPGPINKACYAYTELDDKTLSVKSCCLKHLG